MRILGLFLVSVLVLAMSCGKAEQVPPQPVAKIEVSSVSLNLSSLALDKGQSETLVATVSPPNASDPSVKWSSSNPSVATIYANGMVVGTGGGEATITVTTNNGKSASCLVTVSVPVSSVSLDKTTLVLKKGETFQLSAKVNPEDATDRSLIWSSDKPSIVAVDQSGIVTAQETGDVTITVTASNGKTATCLVSVTVSSTGSENNEDFDEGIGEWN